MIEPNHDQEEHRRDVREIVTELRQKVGNLFHRDSDQSAQKANQYLETKPDDPINPQGPPVQVVQANRLDVLKQIIQQSANKSAAQQIPPAEIVVQTKATLATIAQEGKVESHLSQFFGRLAEQEGILCGISPPRIFA